MKLSSNLINKVSSVVLKSIPATMDSTTAEVYSSKKNKKGFEASGLPNLSPVTNLTLNLSGLSTSVTGTPIRRISWSSPFQKYSRTGIDSEDLSGNESPTFEAIFSRKSKPKHKMRKCSSKVIDDSEDEKENLRPPYYTKHFLARDSDENIQSCSQDSGYSGMPEKYCFESPVSSSLTQNKSCFFDDDEEDFQNMLQLGEIDIDKMSPVPVVMSSLLTSPLVKSRKTSRLATNSRYRKLPIRRCLSMDMDSESDSSTSESSSKVETFVSPLIASEHESDSSGKAIFKRPDPPNDYLSSYNKRRKSCASEELKSTINTNRENFTLQRSFSETAATIMHALLKADLQPELVGDGSRSYALPLVKGRHQDLKSISPETLAKLLKGEFDSKIENFTLVDCRYPYEFEGGHILGAKNVYTKEDILATFLENSASSYQKEALIFHCEFSSERAPTLCRFLRNKDREKNEGNYPHLYHPEIYILEGGYKAFFENHKEFCEPKEYKPMNHKDHGFELRHFRAKSKSLGAESKGRFKLRSNSKHTLI